MICKECGAYNPDHATYCKVCAASLKADAAPKAAEEEPQPTKRFSRPSWIAPEQPEPEEKVVEEAATAAEDIAEAAEPVEEAVAEEIASDEVPEQEEETPVPIWSPTRSRMVPEPTEPDDDESEEDSEEPEDEDENDSIYNDEEALEDEEDAFEYEPTPPKRKQQKKKKNTLFTVLLIAIIVVIVGILVLGGYMLLKNQLNCSGSTDKTQPDAQQTDTQTEPDPGSQTVSEATEAPVLDSRNAQLQEYIDENGADMLAITYVCPPNCTITIDFPNQPDYTLTNTDTKDLTRKVKIPAEVFYPNTPLESYTMEFQPEISITQADGSSYKVNCPTFTREFSKVNITITAPIPEGDEPYMAPESNEVHLTGTIDDTGADVFVDGVQIPVYTGGVFMYDYKFPADATEDTVETITVTASKANCISDTKEIQVHAYKFIPEPMTLEVKSEGPLLRADKNGKLTVTGTTLPGATLEAISDNSTNVLCGSVTVDGDGNFSFQITTDPSFYGISVITLKAEKEGAESGSTQFKVLRLWSDRKEFRQYYYNTKSYIEFPKIDDLIANISQYASNAYGYHITARVVEVITIDGDMIVKMTINKTNETVYVHNYSEVWKPEDNVGQLYNVWGSLAGLYSDTGCLEFYGWYAKKP